MMGIHGQAKSILRKTVLKDANPCISTANAKELKRSAVVTFQVFNYTRGQKISEDNLLAHESSLTGYKLCTNQENRDTKYQNKGTIFRSNNR